ncbi:hypothetical protein PMAYCL1PPCAC_33317, partial [Pristionchus mayeri]
QKHLCANCLLPNHKTRECKNTKRCFNCNDPHHTSTCTRHTHTSSRPCNDDPPASRTKNTPSPTPTKNQPSRQPNNRRPQQTHCAITEEIFEETTMTLQSNAIQPIVDISNSSESTQPLLCIDATLHSPINPNHSLKTTVLFDCASTCSYITSELAAALELPLIESKRIATQVFGKKKVDQRTVGIFPIGVTLSDGSQKNIATLSTPLICNEIDWLRIENDAITQQRSSPGLLIGMDAFLELFIGDNFSMSQNNDGIHILSTPMGDIATKKRINNRNLFSTILTNPSIESIPDLAKLEEMMRNFYSVEMIGVSDSPELTDDDNKAYDHFLKFIQLKENEKRYYVALPFREENPQLPTNFGLAVDNYFGQASSVEEGTRQFHEVREFFAKASFNLREFVSNNRVLNELFAANNVAASDLENTKILGVHWNTTNDTYSLPPVKRPSNETKWTKRLILRHLIFVRNRTSKIKSLLPDANFRHIEGTNNPADVSSRGCTSDEREEHPLWWKGPHFLTQPPSTWSPQPILSSSTLKETTMATAAISTDPIHNPIPPIVDATRFSTWTKLMNTMILVLKFNHRLKKIPTSPSRVSLYRRAEQLLFKMSQTEYPPSPHLIKQLRMYQCPTSSLWRCRGRIDNSEVPIEAKHPIYLPRESPITRLYIIYRHCGINHFDQQHTLTELRQRVWIPKGVTTVKSALRHCMQCKRARAKPFGLPEFPNLPEIRTVQATHPFSAVGIDLAGPRHYRTGDGNQSKCWLIILTCLHIRATFLDVITDVSLKTLLSRIRRFVASYGSPSTILRNDRSAIVKTGNGTLHRPLSLLYKLEIDDPKSQSNENDQPKSNLNAQQPEPENPPLRRSARLNPTISLLVTIALLSTVGATSDARCPQSTSTRLHITYVTPCTQHGFGVATIRDLDDKNQRMCWQRMICPKGHLRMPPSNETNTGYCGPECQCPKWTRTCSFYNGKHANSSSINNIPSELKQYVPPQVCSFTRESHCEINGLYGLFSQIQLMDGTVLIVPKLDITTTDVFTPDDHRCFGMDGQEWNHFTLSSHTPVTGSSSFCHVHSCSSIENANAFCFYGEKVTSISIRACVNEYCIFVQELHATENPILFPWSLVAEDHEITVQSWNEGIVLPDEKIHCQGRPVCERIRCKLCVPFALAPSCWNYYDSLSLIFSIFVVGFIISRILDLCTILSFIFRGIRRVCCFFIRRAPPTINPIQGTVNPNPYYRPRRIRWKRAQLSTAMLAIMLITFPTTQSCSEVSSIRAEEHECSRSQDGILHCTISNSALLTLRPIGQTSCLVIRDANGEMGTIISIRVDQISHKCDKQTMYFTRSHEFTTTSHHVCGDAFSPGACDGVMCNAVNHSAPIHFFESTSPGFNHCASSCGCITCGGCVSCSPSCVFYRNQINPTSSIIFEAFRCLQWISYVKVQIELENNGNDQMKHSIELRPGETNRWNDLTITLISASSSHAPILSSHFLTDGTRTTIIEDAAPSLFIPGSAGQVQCGTRTEAIEFKCQFQPSTCTCQTASTSASCTCPDGNVERFFKEHHTLPLQRQGIQLMTSPNGIEAQTTDNQVLQVKVNFDNLLLDTMQDFNECTISTSSAVGCFNCMAGNQFETNCISSSSETSTTFSCTDTNNSTIVSTIVKCSQNGIQQQINFSSDTPEIALNCSYRCPGERSQQAKSTTVTGTLLFVDEVEKTLHQTASAVRTSAKSSIPSSPSFNFPLLPDLQTVSIVIIAILILFIIISRFFPPVC